MKLSELPMHPPKILLCGDPGSGKTALALTLGKSARVIDLDNGLRTGLTLKDKFESARREVDVRPCWEENPEKAIAFSKARSFISALATECATKTQTCRALVVDSLTTLAEFAMRNVLAANGKLGKPPEIQHWGLSFLDLENVFVALRSLPIVVVVVAHLQRTEEDGVTKSCILMSGQKMPYKIPAYFDEVWVMKTKRVEQGKTKYLIQTKSSTTFSARSRSNLEDNLDADLGLPEILKLMGYDITKGATDVPGKV